MKQQSRTRLRKEADRLFSKLIRARDKVCQRCGHDGSKWVLQCAHLISRRYLGLRWDEMNAVALCLRCHKWGTEHPLEWEDWCIDRLGSGVWSALRDRALIRDPAKPDYQVVIARLKAGLRDLEPAA